MSAETDVSRISKASTSDRGDVFPIHLLPPEILADIFELVVASYRQTHRNPSNSHINFTTWFNFTYVSHRWRSIALSTPSIWATLLFLSRGVVTLMLDRSKSAGLVIDSDLTPASSSMIELIKEVLNNYTLRIRELRLRIPGSVFLLLMNNLIERAPCLRLHSLCLILRSGVYPSFPNAIMAETKDLHTLESDGFAFDWQPSQTFPRLTCLKMSDVPDNSTLSNFIAAICGMPVLETLELQNSLPFALSSNSYSLLQPVSMARLQSLYISSARDFDEITQLLALINVPSTTNIRIDCQQTRCPTSVAKRKIDTFAASLATFFSAMYSGDIDHKNVFKSLWASSTNRTRMRVLACRADVETTRCMTDLELNIQIGSHYPEELLNNIFPSLPLLDLLSFFLDFGIHAHVLLKTFGTLPHLRRVELRGDSMPNFVTVLIPKPKNDGSVPFLALRFLSLRGGKFSSKFNGGLEVDELQSCLVERRDHGVGLETLKIFGCLGIYEEDIRRLKEIVPEVVWRG